MKIELMRKIEVVPIGSIKPYENNPRVNDDIATVQSKGGKGGLLNWQN